VTPTAPAVGPRAAGPPAAGPRAPLAVGPLALLVDEAWGEPPARLHPVVWMGHYLDRAGRLVPTEPPVRATLAGGLAWGVGLVAATAAGRLVDRLAARLPTPLGLAVRSAALSTLLSSRLLRTEVAAVEDALVRSVEEGRAQVARLVSRDTATLTATEVRAAALSTLSENLCDSVVAPLLAHAVGGLPGAAAYRYVNTADAMWGYRDARRRHAGTVAARADDLANLLPARLSGLLLLGPRAASPRDVRRLRQQARLTPSPNGGWPMGALALRLGVRLPKPGVYELGAGGRDPQAADTAAALRLVAGASIQAAAVAAGVTWLAGRTRLRTRTWDRPRAGAPA
jgi:adenosylcobinamide-phosphate synthase